MWAQQSPLVEMWQFHSSFCFCGSLGSSLWSLPLPNWVTTHWYLRGCHSSCWRCCCYWLAVSVCWQPLRACVDGSVWATSAAGSNQARAHPPQRQLVLAASSAKELALFEFMSLRSEDDETAPRRLHLSQRLLLAPSRLNPLVSFKRLWGLTSWQACLNCGRMSMFTQNEYRWRQIMGIFWQTFHCCQSALYNSTSEVE